MRVDRGQAKLLGVSSQVLAQSLSAVVSGITVTQLRDGIYLIDVVARADEQERVSPDALRTLQVPLPNGGTVPLLQLATVEYAQDWPLVWRRDRTPTLTVQSDLVANVLPATVVDALQAKVQALDAEWPDGHTVAPGGAVEGSAKATASVAAVVPTALLIMPVVLMIQLQGFNRLFLVLSVAPFGLIGVVAALLILGNPLGFAATFAA